MAPERPPMKLEGARITRPDRFGPTYQLSLRFGEKIYCLVELRDGDDPTLVAAKLRDFADQLDEYDRVPPASK